MTRKKATPSEAKTVWYQEGLRFECTQCGRCCGGAPGYVWVNREETERMAESLNMDVDAFEKQYVRRVGIRRSLKELPNGDCVFLDEHSRRCTVYENRPRQCRSWPFWESNLRTPEAWQRTCEVCPGSGHGTLYQLQHIEQQRRLISI